MISILIIADIITCRKRMWRRGFSKEEIYTRIEEMESDYGEIFRKNDIISDKVLSTYNIIIRNVNRKFEDSVQEFSNFIIKKINEDI